MPEFGQAGQRWKYQETVPCSHSSYWQMIHCVFPSTSTKHLIKTDCSLQCIFSWKLLLLCHFVIKICDITPTLSILVKDQQVQGLGIAKIRYYFDFGVPSVMFFPLIRFPPDHIFLLFLEEIFLILVSFNSALVYWFSNSSVLKCNLEELI